MGQPALTPGREVAPDSWPVLKELKFGWNRLIMFGLAGELFGLYLGFLVHWCNVWGLFAILLHRIGYCWELGLAVD